jgi:cell division transport system permease protein
MSVATVTIIAITIAAIGGCLGIFWYFNSWIQRGEGKMEMVTYLEDGYAPLDSAVVLRKAIEAIDGVQKSVWIAKDSAMQEFRRLYGSEMLEGIDDNPFPASFRIVPNPAYLQSDSLEQLQAQLSRIPGVEEVGYGKEWFPVLEKIRTVFGFVALGIGSATLLAFYWMVATTIQFSIYSRRDIIEIMQLVGATRTFIKIPFYLEALLQGLLGSLIAALFLWTAYQALSRKLAVLVPLREYTLFFLTGTCCLGMLMSFLSSRKALQKYIK